MFPGGALRPSRCCSTLQRRPAGMTTASWDGTWMASLFIFVPWITGQVLTQPSRSLLICECSELDGFFVLGASLTAWLADGVLAHDLVTHACRHSALPELWPFAALYRAASHFDSVPVVPKCGRVRLCMQVTGSALRPDWFTRPCPVPSGSSALCNMHMSEQSDHMHAMLSSRHFQFKLP